MLEYVFHMFKNTFLLITLTLAGCTTATSTPSSDADAGQCTMQSTQSYCATVDCNASMSMDSCGVEHQPADCADRCGDAGIESCESLWMNICSGHCGGDVYEAPRCGTRTMTCP